MNNNAKDLFQLQTELVQMKVDMAVNRTIDGVIEQITSLKHEMHAEISGLKTQMNAEIGSLKTEMNNRFSSLDNRVIAIETKLGIAHAKRKGWYDRLLDLIFKAGWAWLSLVFAYLIIHVK
jgi:hypothetical protein